MAYTAIRVRLGRLSRLQRDLQLRHRISDHVQHTGGWIYQRGFLYMAQTTQDQPTQKIGWYHTVFI